MAVMDDLKRYSSPKSKLTTLIKKGELIKVRRGLYLPGNCSWYSTKTLANIIYGPSYISFEYALSHYGLIPETVSSVTSACFNKNKNKIFKTPVGVFLYRYVNATVYPYGIQRMDENGEQFLMASPEKAVCDTLSKVRGISSLKDMESFLSDDMRMDMDGLGKMDVRTVAFLSSIYKKRIISLFHQFLKSVINAGGISIAKRH
jgi:predicted transcriptional regulator of viral defense system